MNKLIASGSFSLLHLTHVLPISLCLHPTPSLRPSVSLPGWVSTSLGSFGRSVPATLPSSQTQNLAPRKQKHSQHSPYPNIESHPTPDSLLTGTKMHRRVIFQVPICCYVNFVSSRNNISKDGLHKAVGYFGWWSFG